MEDLACLPSCKGLDVVEVLVNCCVQVLFQDDDGVTVLLEED
jgi:hypothetical protein